MSAEEFIEELLQTLEAWSKDADSKCRDIENAAYRGTRKFIRANRAKWSSELTPEEKSYRSYKADKEKQFEKFMKGTPIEPIDTNKILRGGLIAPEALLAAKINELIAATNNHAARLNKLENGE